MIVQAGDATNYWSVLKQCHYWNTFWMCLYQRWHLLPQYHHMPPIYCSQNCCDVGYKPLLLDLNKMKASIYLSLLAFSYFSFCARTHSLCCSQNFPASSQSDKFVVCTSMPLFTFFRFSAPVTPATYGTHSINWYPVIHRSMNTSFSLLINR